MNNQPENQVTDVDAAEPQKFSVGAVLREAREQQGLSVADVANRIKFAPRQIEAMEADDYAQLPEATFVRGFVRSYARLLEIDVAPLLAALPQTHVQAAPVPEKKSVEVPFPSVLAARHANIMWFAAALAVALVLFILSRMHDSVTTTSTEPVVKSSVETQELALPVASAPVVDAMAAPAVAVLPVEAAPDVALAKAQPLPAQTGQTNGRLATEKPAKEITMGKKSTGDMLAAGQPETKPARVKKPAPELVGPPLPKAQKPAVVPASGVPATADGQPVAGGTQIAVRMSFDEDSWVDVKDGTGRLMLSRLNHAGSLVRMSGVAPISIVIGHAKGVHVYHKGKEINLAPHINGEKARLVLE